MARRAIEEFPGVPGRLQLLREVRGIKLYNDTTAVIPQATLAGLEAFGSAPIILIMGGGDKGISAESLAAHARHRTKRIILLSGSGTDRIRASLPDAVVHNTLEEAVADAMAHASQGDIVLFSPAFSSYNMFKNPYDRGDRFDAIVQCL